MTGLDGLLDAVDWEQLPEPTEPMDGLYATHQGYLEIAGIRLKVYVLNDESRVFDADSVAEWLGSP